MAQPQLIPSADLLVDVENPRLIQGSQGQRETFRAIAEEQGPKLSVLAKDIAEYGLNPGDPLYVIELPASVPQRFIVLEGNRRLAALRALENTDMFEVSVKAGVLTALRRIGKAYQQAPIDNIYCVLFVNREEAEHWILLRHTGQAGGAGIIPWGSDAATRFKARGGVGQTETQALDFLQRRGDLSAADRARTPATTLRRLLETPRIRERIGLGLEDRRLKLLADQEPVARALQWIVNGLIAGDIREPQVSTIQDRIKFANTLPPEILVTSTGAEAVDLASVETPTRTRQPQVRPPKPRNFLIPKDCAISVADERQRKIEWELRKLDLEQFTNSVGVMFRVFIELSCDSYIDRANLPKIKERDTLAKKLKAVTVDLQSRAKLSDKQATPVLKACEPDSLLAPSINLMNQYVHNPYLFPSDTDLRAAWDNLEPFVIAVWTP